MTDINLTCERFEALLPDYLERTPDAAGRDAAERHLRDCARCAALVRDLDAIVHEAGALPLLSPSRDLWTGIVARIDTPVVAIGAGSERAALHAPRRAHWLRLGAAAAALVLLTAGVTYSVTARMMGAGDAAPVASATPAATSGAGSAPVPAALAAPAAPQAVASAANVPAETPRRTAPDTRRETSASAAPMGATPVTAVSRPSESRRVYDREIAALGRILEERRDVIDPVTAAILEHNLKIIDRAIADSREALRQDPASRFLGEQLDRALDKKLELMRTAALLPSRS